MSSQLPIETKIEKSKNRKTEKTKRIEKHFSPRIEQGINAGSAAGAAGAVAVEQVKLREGFNK